MAKSKHTTISRRAILAVVALCAMAGVAHAGERESLALQVVGNGLILMDCHQTMRIAAHPETYRELNPLLGVHPSKERVLASCAAWLLTVNLLDYVLDEKWSNILWIGVIGGHGAAVANNWSVGLRFNF